MDIKEEILSLVERYARESKDAAKPFAPGDRVNYAGRVYDGKELRNLVDSSLDFWLTAGRYAKQFESGLASFLGLSHCLMANSGSSANLLAFMALCSPKLGERRIEKGDEVITVAACFPTTVAPIVQAGAVPVFIDISMPSYNADATALEEAITPRSKAVFLAHTLGNPFDVAAVKAFCSKHGLWLIEDNCDALGSRFRLDGNWAYTGTFGDIGTLSFYPAHHITTGEGGAVCSNSMELRRIAESLRDWGRDCHCGPGQDNSCLQRFSKQYGSLPFGYDHKYVYSHLGYNLKATDMQAAIGCAQLEKLPSFIEARKRNWRHLRDALKPFEDRLILPACDEAADPSWFGFLVSVRDGSPVSRDAIVRFLEGRRIQTRSLFAGNVIRHPCFEGLAPGKDYRALGGLPNTDKAMNDAFWLGVYPGLTSQMLDYVVESVAASLEQPE